jgi:c-di-GMP-binding flagellar brake protein YcgR
MPASAALSPPVEAGQHVHVRLPHVGALPATIEGCAGGVISLVLAVPDARVQRLGGAEATVEWTTGRGIQRILGALELVPGRADVLRVAVHGDVERIQRRDWARVEAIVPVRVRGIDENVGGDTSTLNISGGGVLITDPWNLPLGLDVRIELESEPGGQPIRALGRIVREAAKDKKGIRIDDIARDDEERLVKLVRDRERAALRTARGR